MREYEAAAK